MQSRLCGPINLIRVIQMLCGVAIVKWLECGTHDYLVTPLFKPHLHSYFVEEVRHFLHTLCFSHEDPIS